MIYNLRSDIIYYKSGSDFELEFNLCGCCRMRLLTDKPSNKKAFVHSLARAVARSRVILIAGPIFGDENTIEIVAQALGAKTEIVDNAAYGIASDEEINIIKGALPLVSNDGSFGGCIIESGPQTMILLTDNKALRKNLMSTLIHPYISELYTAEINGNKKTAEKPASESSTEELGGELDLIPAEAESETEAVDSTQTLTEADEILQSDDSDEVDLYMPVDMQPAILESEIASGTINEKELFLEEDVEEDPALILSVDDIGKRGDITEDDIFIDTPETIAENYAPDKDITIDDLFPDTPDFVEATRTLDEKIEEANIIVEEEEYVVNELPEAYHTTFNNLFTDDDDNNDAPLLDEVELSSYNLFEEDEDDKPEPSKKVKDTAKKVSDEDTEQKSMSKLHIATIVITAILLLSIILLCYAIFSASSEEGIAPTQYIKEVWQVFWG